MENKGLVSVIIPVYNVEKYLNECVESVLKQTYKNYEIILVDDGSTDSSGRICDDYAEKYECINVLHKENSGISSARNEGFALAQGEYAYFLDSDDYIDENAFSMLVDLIEKEGSDFVFFDSYSFEDKNINFNIPQNYIRKQSYGTTNGMEMLETLWNNSDFHSAVQMYFFKKFFIEKNNMSFLNGVVFEDVLFSYKAFCNAEIVTHLSFPIYYRRYRDNSIMTSSRKSHHLKSIIAVLNELDLCSSSTATSGEEDGMKRLYLSRYAFNVFNIYDDLSKKDKLECKAKLNEAKNKILSKNAYGSMALKMRCYGKVFWFGYKVLEKTVGRFFI